jgi:hypothetical protein
MNPVRTCRGVAALWSVWKPVRTGLVPVLLLSAGLSWGARAASGQEAAFPPSETIFPATTRLWVSTRDAPATRKAFESTQYGALVRDPVMKPFVDRFREQVRESGRQRMKKLGLTLEDIEMLPGGELAIGIVEPVRDVAATLLVVDARGHERELQKVVESITARMAENGARRLPPHPQLPALVAFDLPPDPDAASRNAGRSARPAPPPRQERAAYAIVGSAFVIGDDLDLVVQTVQCLPTGRADSVASLAAFEPAMRRSGEGVPAGTAPLTWYVDPLAYGRLMETITPARDSRSGAAGRRNADDPLRADLLLANGFDCIKGAGGHVLFAHGGHEVWHRSFVHAPPLPGRDPNSPDRFKSAARMLRFPNVPEILPEDWVPADASGWTAFEWDTRTAFRSSEPLVDGLFGEKGVFEDTLWSLQKDSDGPQIDFESDLVAHLGTRVGVMTDYAEPMGPDSERLVIAIEARNEPALAATIGKIMKAENRRRVEENEIVIWELVETTGEVPKPQIGNGSGDDGSRGRGGPREERDPDSRILKHSAVAVTGGQLLIASHIDILRHVLSRQPPLTGSTDYRRVATESVRLVPGPVALRSFERGDESLRPAYEALKAGQMPKSSSLLGQLLNALLGDGTPEGSRRQRVDGSPLPAFDLVKRYFGPTGVAVESVVDGWLVQGFSLSSADPAGSR